MTRIASSTVTGVEFLSRRRKGLARLETAFLDRSLGPEELSWSLGAYLSDLIAEFDYSISHAALFEAVYGETGQGQYPSLTILLEKVYGCKAARVMPSGSSLANVVLLGFVIRKMNPERNVLLVDSLSHQSVTGGVIVSGLDSIQIPRRPFSLGRILDPLRAEDVSRAVSDVGASKIAGLHYTASCYNGFRHVEEERQIYELCRAHKIPVIVDGAWTATHGLFDHFPPAVYPNADAVIISPHKKGLTPSSIGSILFGDPDMAGIYDKVLELGLVTTSFPHFLAMAAEFRLAELQSGQLDQLWENLAKESRSFVDNIDKSLKSIRIINAKEMGATHSDPSHLLFDLEHSAYTGFEAQKILEARFRITAEKASNNDLLFLIGPEHIDELQQLEDGLKFIDSQRSS